MGVLPMRVLLVEDDAVLCDGLTRVLRAEHYAVDVATDGMMADRAAREVDYALVILDIGLPGIDGLEVLRRARQRGNRVPVLLLTARDAIEDRVEGLDAGADDYLQKPFATKELLARARALIRRSAASPESRLTHGPLTMDLDARRAFLGDVPLELSVREWSVLRCLLARIDRVVSKEQIIEAIAGWDDDLTPNAVEVYVSRLRAKIEPAGVEIRTVRGFGYMIGPARAI